MLTEDLARRLHDAADAPPFVPDVKAAALRGRQLRRRRRLSQGAGAAAACVAITVAGIEVGSLASQRGQAPTLSEGAFSAQQPEFPVAVRITDDSANGVACAALEFTQTHDKLSAGCVPLDFPKGGEHAPLAIEGSGRVRVHPGAAPTTIAYGELAGGGTIIVADEDGRRIRAAVVSAPNGYPYSVFYADLGTGLHWMKSVTYIATNGRQQVFQMGTPAPPTPTDSPG